MTEVTLKLNNCMDCPHHSVIPDPDPNDWFCDDDVAVVCKLTTTNSRYKSGSQYWSDRQNDHECVTTSCRPYNKRRECEVPNWCPLMVAQNKETIEA